VGNQITKNLKKKRKKKKKKAIDGLFSLENQLTKVNRLKSGYFG